MSEGERTKRGGKTTIEGQEEEEQEIRKGNKKEP